MKILVVRQGNPFISSNASNNRFLTLVEGLVEQDCCIYILFLNGFLSKSERLEFKTSGTVGKINYEYLIPINLSNFIKRQLFNRIVTTTYMHGKINKILKNNIYDFVWLDTGANVVKVGIKLFKSNPNIKYFHERSEYSWIAPTNKDLHEKYLKNFLPKISILALMTHTLIDYYKEFVGKKTKIIHVPMTVDFSRFTNFNEQLPCKKPYIAYCGGMFNIKDGVSILIKSFINIMNEFPDLSLYLAGPCIPLEDYKMQQRIIKEASAEERIIYLGIIDRDLIPSFLYNANVLALARPASKQAEGGFPTKLGEYLATGKPVCVTKVGEIEHYLEDRVSAFLAEPGSISSFANSLKAALTDNKSKEIGLLGKEVAYKHFDKIKQTEKLYKYLDEGFYIDNYF